MSTLRNSAIGLLIALALYVLSFGPVWFYVNSRPHSQLPAFVVYFYTPLLQTCGYVPPLRELMDLYVAFWQRLLT